MSRRKKLSVNQKLQIGSGLVLLTLATINCTNPTTGPVNFEATRSAINLLSADLDNQEQVAYESTRLFEAEQAEQQRIVEQATRDAEIALTRTFEAEQAKAQADYDNALNALNLEVAEAEAKATIEAVERESQAASDKQALIQLQNQNAVQREVEQQAQADTMVRIIFYVIVVIGVIISLSMCVAGLMYFWGKMQEKKPLYTIVKDGRQIVAVNSMYDLQEDYIDVDPIETSNTPLLPPVREMPPTHAPIREHKNLFDVPNWNLAIRGKKVLWGQDQNGKLYDWNVESSPHTSLIAASGAGKDGSITKPFITQCLQAGHIVCTFNAQASDYKVFNSAPNYHDLTRNMETRRGFQYFVKMIFEIQAEMDRRSHIMAERDITTWSELSMSRKEALGHSIVFVMSEFIDYLEMMTTERKLIAYVNEFLEEDDKCATKKEAQDELITAIGQILRKSRKYGIYTLFVYQLTNNGSLPAKSGGLIRATTRIVGNVKTPANSMSALGNRDAANLNVGEFIYQADGEESVLIKGFFPSTHEIKMALENNNTPKLKTPDLISKLAQDARNRERARQMVEDRPKEFESQNTPLSRVPVIKETFDLLSWNEEEANRKQASTEVSFIEDELLVWLRNLSSEPARSLRGIILTASEHGITINDNGDGYDRVKYALEELIVDDVQWVKKIRGYGHR